MVAYRFDTMQFDVAYAIQKDMFCRVGALVSNCTFRIIL